MKTTFVKCRKPKTVGGCWVVIKRDFARSEIYGRISHCALKARPHRRTCWHHKDLEETAQRLQEGTR